jgi:hypothetical protein
MSRSPLKSLYGEPDNEGKSRPDVMDMMEDIILNSKLKEIEPIPEPII